MFRIGKYFVMTGLALMLTISTFAQRDADGDPDDEVVPFDGGVSLLVAAGVSYGVKQWRDNRKTKNEEKEELEG